MVTYRAVLSAGEGLTLTEAEEKAFIADRVLERRDSKKALEAVREEMRTISKALKALAEGIGSTEFAAQVQGGSLEFFHAAKTHSLDFALIISVRSRA
jgi:hypothetical protein